MDYQDNPIMSLIINSSIEIVYQKISTKKLVSTFFRGLQTLIFHQD